MLIYFRYVQMCETKTWSFMEMYLHVKEDLNKLVVFNPQNFSRIEPVSSKLVCKVLPLSKNIVQNVDQTKTSTFMFLIAG